jgi:hypothetical protein
MQIIRYDSIRTTLRLSSENSWTGRAAFRSGPVQTRAKTPEVAQVASGTRGGCISFMPCLILKVLWGLAEIIR